MLEIVTFGIAPPVRRSAAAAGCSQSNAKDGTSAERALPRGVAGTGALIGVPSLTVFGTPSLCDLERVARRKRQGWLVRADRSRQGRDWKVG
jgi:hypothetical protein